jgi:ATP-binding cassette, subfamily B, bacterial IrtB/YbtQ
MSLVVHFTGRNQIGEIVAITGRSGEGKSTLIKILAGLYRPSTGSVMYGDVELRNWDPELLSERVSVVFQENFIFSDTVYNNALFGRHGSSKRDVRILAQQTYFDEFIRNLPEGYETILGENGSTLSGGQKQRVAILRGLMKDPKVIILDEPSAALDIYSQKLLWDYLNTIKQNKIIIIA